MCIKILKRLLGTFEWPSPADWIRPDEVKVEGDRITIDLSRLLSAFSERPDISTSSVADTNSMDPVIDIGDIYLALVPKNDPDKKMLCDRVRPGDIIVYWHGGRLILHRITRTGTDEHGRFFRLQGDNNPVEDPWKVRDGDLFAVWLGVVH